MNPSLTDLLAKCRIESDGGCWIWRGHHRKGKNLPIASWREGRKVKTRSARLVVYEAVNGPVKSGHRLTFSCDNPMCVNPEHTLVGTVAKITREAHKLGRWINSSPTQRARITATKRAMSPLDWDKVSAIRESTESERQAAARFGVSARSIGRVRNFETWRPITSSPLAMLCDQQMRAAA